MIRIILFAVLVSSLQAHFFDTIGEEIPLETLSAKSLKGDVKKFQKGNTIIYRIKGRHLKATVYKSEKGVNLSLDLIYQDKPKAEGSADARPTKVFMPVDNPVINGFLPKKEIFEMSEIMYDKHEKSYSKAKVRSRVMYMTEGKVFYNSLQQLHIEGVNQEDIGGMILTYLKFLSKNESKKIVLRG